MGIIILIILRSFMLKIRNNILLFWMILLIFSLKFKKSTRSICKNSFKIKFKNRLMMFCRLKGKNKLMITRKSIREK